MGSTANRMRIEILLTGSNGVGKTALATQYQQHVFTFGVEQICETALRKQITIDDRVALLDVLDCAAELNSMSAQYFLAADVVIIMFDITDRKSFEQTAVYYAMMQQVTKRKNLFGEPSPLILCGNKCDLADTSARAVTTDEGNDLAKSWGTVYFETSAKDRTSVDEMFTEAARLCLQETSCSDQTTSHQKRCIMM